LCEEHTHDLQNILDVYGFSFGEKPRGQVEQLLRCISRDLGFPSHRKFASSVVYEEERPKIFWPRGKN